MSHQDHQTVREWLDLYVDGGLPQASRAVVESHLQDCGDCRRDRLELERLQSLLVTARVPVREDFSQQVMERVRSSAPAVVRPGLLAAAVLILLAAGALLVGSLAGPGGESAGWSVAAALADFVGSAMVAGAGLLAASWRGVGTVVNDWILASTSNLLLSLLVVVGLNVLAFRLLRRRRAAVALSKRGDGDGP